LSAAPVPVTPELTRLRLHRMLDELLDEEGPTAVELGLKAGHLFGGHVRQDNVDALEYGASASKRIPATVVVAVDPRKKAPGERVSVTTHLGRVSFTFEG